MKTIVLAAVVLAPVVWLAGHAATWCQIYDGLGNIFWVPC
jgi:hypothetical protein